MIPNAIPRGIPKICSPVFLCSRSSVNVSHLDPYVAIISLYIYILYIDQALSGLLVLPPIAHDAENRLADLHKHCPHQSPQLPGGHVWIASGRQVIDLGLEGTRWHVLLLFLILLLLLIDVQDARTDLIVELVEATVAQGDAVAISALPHLPIADPHRQPHVLQVCRAVAKRNIVHPHLMPELLFAIRASPSVPSWQALCIHICSR